MIVCEPPPRAGRAAPVGGPTGVCWVAGQSGLREAAGGGGWGVHRGRFRVCLPHPRTGTVLYTELVNHDALGQFRVPITKSSSGDPTTRSYMVNQFTALTLVD